jgi:hypothetical protein
MVAGERTTSNPRRLELQRQYGARIGNWHVSAALNETIVVNDPATMSKAALLSLGVALISVPEALPYLEGNALVRLVPSWYADLGPISLYYATRTLLAGQNARLCRFRPGGFSAGPLGRALRGKSRIGLVRLSLRPSSRRVLNNYLMGGSVTKRDDHERPPLCALNTWPL